MINVIVDQDLRSKIYSVLESVPDVAFIHGRTAAYWNIVSILEKHIAPLPGRLLKLELDKWDVAGKIFELISYSSRPGSTGVLLEIKDEDGTISKLVVPSHSIEWID